MKSGTWFVRGSIFWTSDWARALHTPRRIANAVTIASSVLGAIAKHHEQTSRNRLRKRTPFARTLCRRVRGLTEAEPVNTVDAAATTTIFSRPDVAVGDVAFRAAAAAASRLASGGVGGESSRGRGRETTKEAATLWKDCDGKATLASEAPALLAIVGQLAKVAPNLIFKVAAHSEVT